MNDPLPSQHAGPVPPLLRWAGGKRWAADAIKTAADHVDPQKYVEPFVGGAAVFLARHWETALLGDTNASLIHCYQGISQDPALVVSKLRRLQVDRQTYDRVRSWRPRSLTGMAARMLYLNRTAFSGIYRENRLGQFNVPYGGDRSLANLLNQDRIAQVATRLAQAKLVIGDFASLLKSADEHSFVFCDPPYSLPGAEKGFRRYSQIPFEWRDQVRLANSAQDAMERGSTVVVSNADHEMIRGLYPSAAVVMAARNARLGKVSANERKEAIFVLSADARLADHLATLMEDALAR